MTNRPDTLEYSDLKEYDVIVSDWNSYHENELRWSAELESGLLSYLEKEYRQYADLDT